MYVEIAKLYSWCKEQGISCTLNPLFDGYKLEFLDGSDFIQHKWSYESMRGRVEPAGIDEYYDYSGIDLEKAKEIILKKFSKTS